MKMGGLAAVAGPAKLALAVQELGLTRLAPCRRHGAADLKATPLPPAPFSRDWCLVDWCLVDWCLVEKQFCRPFHAFWHRVDLMWGPCWHLFGTCGHDFGTTGHHCGTPGQQVVAWGTHVWNLMRFWRFSGPCGAPFFTIGGSLF